MVRDRNITEEILNSEKVRILIVDDDPLLVETIANIFRKFQFSVDTALSGNTAWELIRNSDYCVVISDIRMPDGDGLSLARKIREMSAPRPGLIVISGFSETALDELYHLGARGFFSKPFDTAAVRNAISACLLAPKFKWSSTEQVANGFEISKSGSTIQELEKSLSVVFGNGGFFLRHDPKSVALGSKVKFSISIEQPIKIVFDGQGIVRWIHKESTANAPAGLGVEIIGMDQDLAEKYTSLFGRIPAFIPSPVHL